MPRKISATLCRCGCGRITENGYFIPGHDGRLVAAIINCVGGVQELKRIIEDTQGMRIHTPKLTRAKGILMT